MKYLGGVVLVGLIYNVLGFVLETYHPFVNFAHLFWAGILTYIFSLIIKKSKNSWRKKCA